ncbi:hypothetical protein LTR84_012583 [Exophiala bonariae]|uniref:Uncharacterized protein n=1 Tax=Exophiala bonariae TaxID=1690606 RepID=A0AAV9NIU4_9EURO|nr:hypothetical protein LTR84_012583 [Exophiala bonariae]
MAVRGMYDYLTGRSTSGKGATSQSDHQQKGTLNNPDLNMIDHTNHNQHQDPEADISEAQSSPDPLNPAVTGYRYHDENSHNDQRKSTHFAAIEPEKKSRLKTRATHSDKFVKHRHETDNDGPDVTFEGSASDSRMEAFAEAYKKVQHLEAELKDQQVINKNMVGAAKDEIDHWKNKYCRAKDRLDDRSIEINKLRGEIDTYQAELKIYEGNEAAYQRKNVALKDQLELVKSHLQEHKLLNHNLEKNLEDCKERIFRSQPFQGQTDTELLNTYTNLCDSIDKWVYKSVADGENNVLRLGDVQSRSDGPIALGDAFSLEEIAAIRQFPTLGNVMVSAFIMRALGAGFLHNEFSRFGLDAVTNDVLGGIAAGVQKLEPAKAIEDCQSWRADLQRVLDLFSTAAGNKLKALNDWQLRILQSVELVGMSDEAVDDIRLDCQAFILEAAMLAEGMYFSTSSYGFRTPALGIGTPLSAQDLKKFNVIDGSTGALLRPKRSPIEDRNGRVGEMGFAVFPAFHRHREGSMSSVELCKATIVVRFDLPVPPVGKPKQTR